MLKAIINLIWRFQWHQNDHLFTQKLHKISISLVCSLGNVERFREKHLLEESAHLKWNWGPLSLIQVGCSCVTMTVPGASCGLSASQRTAVASGHSEFRSIVFGTRVQEWWWSQEKEGMGMRAWEVLNSWNGNFKNVQKKSTKLVKRQATSWKIFVTENE